MRIIEPNPTLPRIGTDRSYHMRLTTDHGPLHGNASTFIKYLNCPARITFVVKLTLIVAPFASGAANEMIVADNVLLYPHLDR